MLLKVFIASSMQVFLETQLETERSRVDAERQRVAVAEEQIRILVSYFMKERKSKFHFGELCM